MTRTVSITNCSACHEIHKDIEVLKDDEGFYFMCPKFKIKVDIIYLEDD